MTSALKPIAESLNFNNTEYAYFTAPSGPSSINGAEDCEASRQACLPALGKIHQDYDAFLVACYSWHPLVADLHALSDGRPVLGIFEASVTASYQLLNLHVGARFGIISTGKVWEDLLDDAVSRMLVVDGGAGDAVRKRFAGTVTTGLSAVELHEAPPEEVERRVKEAAGKLLGDESVQVVCLGCAGMVGMETWVREVASARGRNVKVVDGVKAGVVALQGLLRSNF